MPNSPKVHIVDDDDAVRESLAFLLQTNAFPTVTHESGSSFLATLTLEHQGCVVVDIRMPDISGLDLLLRVKEMQVNMPVIVITGHGDVPLAAKAMKLGAFEFFEKPLNESEIVNAIRSALDQTRDRRRSLEEKTRLLGRIAALSKRERDVLNGLIAGHSNKAIAINLSISPRTVEIYRANVMTKMSANSLSELVRMALIGNLTD